MGSLLALLLTVTLVNSTLSDGIVVQPCAATIAACVVIAVVHCALPTLASASRARRQQATPARRAPTASMGGQRARVVGATATGSWKKKS
jgi:hypothetical protein